MSALYTIIEDLLENKISITKAQKRASILGENPRRIISELWDIGKKVDQLRNTNPDYQLIASIVCWSATHQITNRELKALLAHNLGRSLIHTQDLDKSLFFLDEAERNVRVLGNKNLLNSIQGTRASVMMLKGDLETALELLEKTKLFAIEIGDGLGEANSALLIGQIQHKKGDNDRARSSFIRALQLYRSLGQSYNELQCIGSLAELIASQTKEPKLFRFLSQASALAKVVQAEPSEILNILSRVGKAQINLGALADAEETFKVGMQISHKHNLLEIEGIFTGNIGSVLKLSRRYKEAKLMFEKALSIAEKIGDIQGVRVALHNLSTLDKVQYTTENHESNDKKDNQSSSLNTYKENPSDDQVQKWRDYFLEVATKICTEREKIWEILEEINITKLDKDVASNIAEKVLKLIDEMDSKEPKLAYALSLSLDRWLPADFQPKILIDVHSRISRYAPRAGHTEVAIRSYKILLELAKKTDNNNLLIVSLTNYATALRRKGETQQALYTYECAIKEIKKTTSPITAGMVSLNASTAYLDFGKPERSKFLCELALTFLANQKGQEVSYAFALINLACSYYALNDLKSSEETFLKALKLTRKEKIFSQEGVVLGHLGLICLQQGKISDSIRFLSTAIKIAEENHDTWNLQHWERDLANLYTYISSTDLAIYHLNKALELSRKVRDLRSEGLCLLGLGINTLSKDLETGISYLHESWKLFERTGNARSAFDVALRLASAYVAKSVNIPRIKREITFGRIERLDLDAAAQLKDRESLKLARTWWEQARNLSSVITTPDDKTLLALYEVAILRLEGMTEKAILKIEHSLKSVTNPFLMTRSQAALGDLYLLDLKQPDKAKQYYKCAIDSYENLSQNIDWDRQRITFRNNFWLLYGRLVKCELETHNIDQAFYYCERSKLAEMQRCWALRQQTQYNIQDISTIYDRLAEKGNTAVIEFMLGVNEIYVFIIAPNLRKDEQILVISNESPIKYFSKWLKTERAYEESKFPLTTFDPTVHVKWNTEIEETCNEIGAKLLNPIYEKISNLPIQEIVFIPHSILHCFPLHASPISKNERWIDRYTISYSPSASIIYKQWTTSIAKPNKFIGFADSKSDLPLSRNEIQSMKKQIHQNAQLFYENDVSREKVLAALSEDSWIHFAIHAKQTLDDGYGTGLYINNTEISEDNSLLDLTFINNNIRIKNGTTIILSACETGKVTPSWADELQSIAGGFILAGADTVISTYWKISDVCALLILDQTYSLLSKGALISNALRDSQIWLKNLSEAQVFSRLDSLLKSNEYINISTREEILAEYDQRRTNYRPFDNISDWAAFFITGRTNISI